MAADVSVKWCAVPLAAVLLLAGCGGGEDSPATAPSRTASSTPTETLRGEVLSLLGETQRLAQGQDDYGQQASLYDALAASIEQLEGGQQELQKQQLVQTARAAAEAFRAAEAIPRLCLGQARTGCGSIERSAAGVRGFREVRQLDELAGAL